MRFELTLRFEFGSCEGVLVSDRAKRTADLFQQAKDQEALQNAVELKHSATLDEGFSRMRKKINEALERQCTELNEQPEIGDILVCKVSDDKSTTVTRSDTGVVLSVAFDSTLRTAHFACPKPSKFKYSIDVKLSANGLWFYADGKGTSIGPDLGAVTDKALNALLGVTVG